MNLLRFSRLSAFLLLAIVVAVSEASAGVMTQQVTIDSSIGGAGSLAIDQFDGSLGELTEVQLSYEVLGLAFFSATKPNPSGAMVAFMDLASSLDFGGYAGGNLSGVGVAAFPFGIAMTGPGFGYVGGQSLSTLTDSSVLSLFTSAGNGGILNLGFASSVLASPQFALSVVSSSLEGQLTVSYVYDASVVAEQDPLPNAAVPEPATLAIVGFGALAMLRVRQRSKAGAK